MAVVVTVVMVMPVLMVMMVVVAAVVRMITMMVTNELDMNLWEFQSFLGHVTSGSSVASPFLSR